MALKLSVLVGAHVLEYNHQLSPLLRHAIGAIGRAEKRLKSLWVEGASKRH